MPTGTRTKDHPALAQDIKGRDAFSKQARMAQCDRRDLRAKLDARRTGRDVGKRRPGLKRLVPAGFAFGCAHLLGRQASMVLYPENVQPTIVGDCTDAPEQTGTVISRKSAMEDRCDPVANGLRCGQAKNPGR